MFKIEIDIGKEFIYIRILYMPQIFVQTDQKSSFIWNRKINWMKA